MVDCSRKAQSLNRLPDYEGKLRRLSCKYVMKRKFQRGLYHAQLIFNVNRILDEHKTVMKNFFKETTCTAMLRPIFLGVEQETGPDCS